MTFPITYKRLARNLYAAYIDGEFIGELRKFPSGWLFHTFGKPDFVSEQYAPSREVAIAQWPGYKAFIRSLWERYC